jgi:hypothetical protein
VHSIGFIVFLQSCYGIWAIARCNVRRPSPLIRLGDGLKKLADSLQRQLSRQTMSVVRNHVRSILFDDDEAAGSLRGIPKGLICFETVFVMRSHLNSIKLHMLQAISTCLRNCSRTNRSTPPSLYWDLRQRASASSHQFLTLNQVFLLKSLWRRYAFLSTFVGAFITLETTILSVTYAKMTGTLPK